MAHRSSTFITNITKDFIRWNCRHYRKEETVQIWRNCSRWFGVYQLFQWTLIPGLLTAVTLVVTVRSWWKDTVDWLILLLCTSSEQMQQPTTGSSWGHHGQLISLLLLTPLRVILRRWDTNRWISLSTLSPQNTAAADLKRRSWIMKSVYVPGVQTAAAPGKIPGEIWKFWIVNVSLDEFRPARSACWFFRLTEPIPVATRPVHASDTHYTVLPISQQT